MLEVALALTVPGLTGAYYETMWLDRDGAQPALTRVDAELDFDWRVDVNNNNNNNNGSSSSSSSSNANGADYPGPLVGAQTLSHSRYVGARWTGLVAAEHDEEHVMILFIN